MEVWKISNGATFWGLVRSFSFEIGIPRKTKLQIYMYFRLLLIRVQWTRS